MVAKTKQEALSQIQDAFREQYKRINDYCAELLRTNPGSSGLLPSFEEVILGVDNQYCVRHLYNNFRKKVPGLELKNQMWRCAKSTHWKDWEKEIKSLRLKNEAASKYEVMCGLDKFVVDLFAGECSYRRWQMSGLPCPHAISCINFKGLDLESFVDDYYNKDAYLRCYQEVIHPLNRPDLWERSQYDDVMPPPYRRLSHRPVKKRKRGLGDEDNRSQTHLSRRGQIQRCSNCGGVGHKKSGCTKPKKVQPATQQAGKGLKRGMKVSSSQPPGQIVQRGKLSRTSCSQPNPATTQPNPTTTQRKKLAIRPRKSAAKPTDHSTQPKT
ncbi:hypothetical protein Ahy_B07g088377 [Arachis hypogaea]|uniref:Zinc finger PMZ-type domain-containing protein n=1 Tax=Arachis hypogaea TaxID=3818 RepID=A0A444YEE0_ARAHY|nr:hypothetical protein Ahy_B07g088377 [Arachis hypogaea]